MSAMERIAWISRDFGEDAVLSTALGTEGQVLLHHLHSGEMPAPRIVFIDTGRHFDETYRMLDETQKRYGMRIDVLFPDASDVQSMVREHGINLFRRSVDLRKLCCSIRKKLPLQRALTGARAWITGLRRAQSHERRTVNVVEWNAQHALFKFNPLWDWSDDQVREYAAEHDLPSHPLRDRGFASIGCAPCTRSVDLGEDRRAGRWWWEGNESKECGLHMINQYLERTTS